MSFKESWENLKVEKVSINQVPQYYTLALRSFYALMVGYFCCYIASAIFIGLPENSRIAIPWLALLGALLYFYDSIPIRYTLFGVTSLVISWICIFVVYYGWDCDAQCFSFPLLIILLFSIHTSFAGKLFVGAALPVLGLGLYFYSQACPAKYLLSLGAVHAFQVINTLFTGTAVVVICLIFSTDIQKSARQLLIYNEELKKQATTDALTGLHNRRYMVDMMERYIANHPQGIFCVAMGDIDLFKRINDTYGHECGDEVLREIAALFKSRLKGKSRVCRWGGEEFFFFMPDLNLDEAKSLISDLNIAVSKLDIRYKDMACQVTMTFGVEENDYVSGLKEIIKRADEKLYYGKNNGRNRVIF